MKRPIVILTFLLLAQLGLAAALHFGGAGPAVDNDSEKLLPFEAGQVDGIELAGTEGKSVTLEKGADGWILPDHFAVPAPKDKVENLLSTLGGLTRPWPVAATAQAGKRFKVEEQNCERKLIFRGKGETLATLLLGTSPGFRKVHARLAGEEPIFDIPFSTFQVSLKPEDWLDQQQLQIKPEEISTIELPDCRLTRQDGKFQLDSLKENEQTNQDQAQRLLSRLANLTVRDIFGRADQPLPNPVDLQVKLTLRDGSTREYGFARADKAGYELLQVADSPYLFEVNLGFLDSLKGINRSQLVEAKAAPPPAGQATGKTTARQPPG